MVLYVSGFCFGLLGGAALGSLVQLWVCGLCVALSFIIVWLWGRVGLVFWCGFVLGVLVIGIRLHSLTVPDPEETRYAGKGIISAVSTSNGSQSLVVDLLDTDYKIQATNFQNPSSVLPGDLVLVEGDLVHPKRLGDFDYPAYLRSKGILFELKKQRIIVLQRGSGIRRSLYLLRAYLLSRMTAVYKQPALGLVAGMVLGEKGFLEKSEADNFKRAGLSHVLVVSGYNMTLMVSACTIFAGIIGRRRVNYLAVFSVLFFAVLVGMDAPVVRAGIMALLLVGAQLFGRRYASFYALLLAATAMVVINPLILIWDIGFQLSALATCGVMVAGAWLDKRDHPGWTGYLAPTLGALVFTIPLVSFQFGKISLVALLVNVIAAPMVPVIMFCGLLGMLPFLGALPAILTAKLSYLFMATARIAARQEFAVISVGIPWLVMVLLYGLLAWFMMGLLSKRGRLRERLENDKISEIN